MAAVAATMVAGGGGGSDAGDGIKSFASGSAALYERMVMLEPSDARGGNGALDGRDSGVALQLAEPESYVVSALAAVVLWAKSPAPGERRVVHFGAVETHRWHGRRGRSGRPQRSTPVGIG